MKNKGSLRIVHVVGSLDRTWGGLSLFVGELAAELAELGHTVQILRNPETSRNEWPTGAAEIIRTRPGSKEWKSAFNLADIVHVHGLWLAFYHLALASARRRNKPHLLSVHGMLEPGALRFSGWKKRLALWLYQRSDLKKAPVLHATAEAEAKTLRAFGLRQPIANLPIGVRMPSAAQEHSLCGSSRRAVFLGRVHPVKGILSLIEAWGAVRPEGWKLDLAGSDEVGHFANVQRRLRELNLENEVTYHGAVFGPAKDQLLKQASLLIAPSLTENFGIVVAEGLAYGLPIITTRGTPWEAVERERCGWWVPVGWEPLASALREAIALSPEMLAEMGHRGLALAKNKLSWPRIAEQMAETYRWLTGVAGQPKCIMVD